MKAKTVSIVLAVLLMVLVLPGCVSKAELDECRALVTERETQIVALNSTIEAKDAKISELEKEVEELKKQIPESETTAKIEITFSPNPVPCEEGHWYWKVIITEVNGVGVNVKHVTEYIYRDNELLSTRCFGASKLEEIPGLAYLPPYGTIAVGAGRPCQAITHSVYTVIGIDDNGYKIEASSGRLNVLK